MKKQYVMTGDPKTKKLDKYHLILGLTKSCDLRKCRHCYEEGLMRPGRTDGQMKPEQVKRVLSEFAKIAQTESKENPIAHFKGGEPMVYPHLEEVALHAADLGLDVFITTNGLSVADRIELLDRINKAADGKMRITLSLNGSKPHVDALLRVDTEAYFATLKAAHVLRGAGISFDINYIVHQGNVTDLQQIAMLASEIGAEQLNILQLINAGNNRNRCFSKADPKEMLDALGRIFSTAEGRSMIPGSLPDFIEGRRNGRFAKECVAGYRGLLYIKPDGSSFSCPSTSCDGFLAGNAFEHSIRDLMDSSALKRLRELDISPGCKGDVLTGGGKAKALQEEISARAEGAGIKKKKNVLCIQRNF